MVFVKVRETYDLHTLTNKCSAIGIHTPHPGIIKQNYPGLLMQCKFYRPVSCDVRVACASMLPADPLQVSTSAGDIAPEDLFNPILYKATSNFGMSQIEARINSFRSSTPGGVTGGTADFTNSNLTDLSDEFSLYYGMLQDTNQWRHASPQSGFSMNGLKPIVYEMLYSVGDNPANGSWNTGVYSSAGAFSAPKPTDGGLKQNYPTQVFKGHGKPMPFINCTSYTYVNTNVNSISESGFKDGALQNPVNAELDVPAPTVYVGAIIIPPSRLHQLFYRMVVEWTIEFSSIRSLAEITNWAGLQQFGNTTHYQSYSYSAAKTATGLDSDELKNDTNLVSTDADISKVM